jgi:SulP family sulfate permease
MSNNAIIRPIVPQFFTKVNPTEEGGSQMSDAPSTKTASLENLTPMTDRPNQPSSGALFRFIPGLALFRDYQRQWLVGDALAGVSASVVMIPSMIAYARLMGLPIQNSLYAALVPLVVYPFFCSSRQMIVGPDIAICLLIVSVTAPLAEGDSRRAAVLASALGVMSGLFLLLGSRVKLGKVADFLSKPVLVGYMTGAALILVASQLSGLLGVTLVHNDFFPRVFEAAGKMDQTHLPTLVLGLSLLVLLFGLRRLAPLIPGPLVACLVAIAASVLFHLEQHGVEVVGKFSSGLPGFAVPLVGWHELHSLLPAAVGIAFLAYTEGVLLARAFAEKNGCEISANQELTALGMANFCNGFFQGFSVTGSQSRTTLNDAAGAKTQMSSLAGALSMAVFMVFLTPALAHLPIVALAAILIYGGSRLVEFDAMKRIYRYYPTAAGIAALTTAGVLAAGVVAGILLGVVLSLFGLINRISHPPDAVLREVPGHGFHDVGPAVGETVPGLLAYRFYAPLLFSNAGYFAERVHALIAAAREPVRWFLLDAQAITDIDVTAVEMLHSLRQELKQKGIALKFAHANRPLRELLETTGLALEIGQESFYGSVHECVEAFSSAKF